MSGYCPDCGNTQCLCTEMAVDEAQRKAHSLHRLVSLRPCPFCGTSRTRIHEWIFGAVVICECGARGPEGYGETKIPMACDLWNRREQANDKLSDPA